MTNIDLGEPSPDWVDFHVRRSLAIQGHGVVEQSIFSLLSWLLNDLKAAATIFNAVMASTRNRIIEELLEQRFGSKYSAYFHGIRDTPHRTGMMTLIRGLDGKRNEIVHWHSVRHVTDTAQYTALMPPTFWNHPSPPQITVSDLTEFSAKADFVSRSLNMFGMAVRDDMAQHLEPRVIALFDTPCIYPPAPGHPLIRQ